MSTQPKKKAPPVKLVRRQVPENAIMWVPGTELPDQIQQIVDRKIEAWATEYDQVHADRLKNYRGPAPIELGQIVAGLHYQLSGVYFDQGIEAVGLFLTELKAKAATRLKNEEGTLNMAQSAFDKAYHTRAFLDSILGGNIQVVIPEKRYGFQPGGLQAPDHNLKKADNGEAVVSKRSTN